jgi:hypothetical protein
LLVICFIYCSGGGVSIALVAPITVVNSGGVTQPKETSLHNGEEQFDSLTLRTLVADYEGQVDRLRLDVLGPCKMSCPLLMPVVQGA